MSRGFGLVELMLALLLGALLTALTSVTNAWLVLVGGVVGAAVGYRSQRSR